MKLEENNLKYLCWRLSAFCWSFQCLNVDERPVENVEDDEGTWEEESRPSKRI